MRRVAVLGSTGSVGRSALDVIRRLGPGYRVSSLSANSNWELLVKQALEYRPQSIVVGDPECAAAVKRALSGRRIRVLVGSEALREVAASPQVDIVLLAIMGAAGLPAALSAVHAGKTLAIANKEPLVMAGDLIMAAARRSGAKVLPVDSEHSAVLQAMRGGARSEVRRIIITASGGPFYSKPIREIQSATKEQALAHPTWKMGAKITIDSATLINKALEIIEAKWLFGLRPEQIGVVIHPQSIVHAFVEFCDGSMVAQVAMPDMKLPIQFALTYPDRLDNAASHVHFADISSLTFLEPDTGKFPALELGYKAAREGGTLGAVLSAANETAVAAFLKDRLRFGEIVDVVGRVMADHRPLRTPTLSDVLDADTWARAKAESYIA